MKNQLMNYFFACCLLFVLGVTGVFAKNDLLIQDDRSIFTEANELFESANQAALKNPARAQSLYENAILKYQFLVDRGRGISPELYTNLANAYFYTGDHGRAVLYYHRALTLDPLRSDIRHNLQYVRSLTVDELPQSKTQEVVRVLTFWHRWPFAVRLSFFALGNILLWVLVARRIYRRSRWDKWAIFSVAGLACVFGVSLLVSYQGWDSRVDGVVIGRDVVARQGNGYIYDNAYMSSLHAGTEFDLIEERDGWYHARLLDGSTCWLPKKSSELIRSVLPVLLPKLVKP